MNIIRIVRQDERDDITVLLAPFVPGEQELGIIYTKVGSDGHAIQSQDILYNRYVHRRATIAHREDQGEEEQSTKGGSFSQEEIAQIKEIIRETFHEITRGVFRESHERTTPYSPGETAEWLKLCVICLNVVHPGGVVYTNPCPIHTSYRE